MLNIPANFSKIYEDIRVISEAQNSVNKFHNSDFDNVLFSSINQARFKQKMASIDILQQLSKLVIPCIVASIAYDYVMMDAQAVISKDGLKGFAEDAKVIWDYVSQSNLGYAAIVSASAKVCSVANELRNPSEIRFYKKEKEQNKILKEFFKDELINEMVNEDKLLMMGYVFSDSIRKYDGTDKKWIPLAVSKIANVFSKNRKLDKKTKEAVGATNIQGFIESLSNIPELNDAKEIIRHDKIESDNTFNSRQQANFYGGKIEKAFEMVYRENQLAKTNLIAVKLLIKAEKNPDEFTRLYAEHKKHFSVTLKNEIPLAEKDEYDKIKRLLRKVDNEIKEHKKLRTNYTPTIKKMLASHELGSKKPILEKVKEKFVSIINEEAHNITLKGTSIKKAQETRAEYQKSLKKAAIRVEADNLYNLISNSKGGLANSEEISRLQDFEHKDLIKIKKRKKIKNNR